jgi:hypothetical protein
MDIVDLMNSSEDFRTAQTVFLRGRALEDYDFIFIQDQLEKSLELFCHQFQFVRKDPQFDRIPTLNSGDERLFLTERQRNVYASLGEVSGAAKEKVFLSLPEDIELYEKAKDLFEARCRRAADATSTDIVPVTSPSQGLEAC